jgi:antitoxin component YwqK of YwqJK toxin-antitoxin module
MKRILIITLALFSLQTYALSTTPINLAELEQKVESLEKEKTSGKYPTEGRFTNEYFSEALKLVRLYDYLQDEINEGKFSTLLDGLIELSKINTDLYQYIHLNESWSPRNKEFSSERGYKEHYKYKYKYSFSRQSELLNIRDRLELKQSGDKKITIVIDKMKTIDGSYKNGKPDGVWTAWYPNGKIFAKMKFADVSNYSNDDYNIEIVDIEVRYPDKANTIKYKGNSFADKLLTGVHKDGGIMNYPQWSFISGYFNEVGSEGVYIPVEVYFTDSNTGKHYKFPWIDKYE